MTSTLQTHVIAGILANDPLLSGEVGLTTLLVVLIKVVVAFVGLLLSVILMVWFER